MTTIAWDGKTLAADRQAHHGTSNTKYERKKLSVLDGKAIAGAGRASLNDAMANWITVFVEVPLVTFNPVKTVNDLLKPAHQPE